TAGEHRRERPDREEAEQRPERRGDRRRGAAPEEVWDDRQHGAERERKEGRDCRGPRRAETSRVEAELLAGEGVDRNVGAAYDVLNQGVRGGRRDPLRLIDQPQLLVLLLGERGELLGLDADLVLV